MNTLSFITANYVARETGYHMTGGWSQGHDAAEAYFRPRETFAQRFEALISGIRSLGYQAADLWLAHLSFHWATEHHIAAARASLAVHGLVVPSLACYGENEEDLRAACRLALALDCRMLSGGMGLLGSDRPRLAGILREYGVCLAVENHPEKSAAELLARMGDGEEDVIGAAIDTGWFGTQGCDAAQAVRDLKGRIFHLHAKDVKARRDQPTGFALADSGHETCRLGAGIVPVEACVKTAVREGFTGPISFEHEPENYDPSEDARVSLELLKSWV